MKITVENCLEASSKYKTSGDIKVQSQSWKTVYDFCCQNGMKNINGNTGLEDVITFINNLINNESNNNRMGRTKR